MEAFDVAAAPARVVVLLPVVLSGHYSLSTIMSIPKDLYFGIHLNHHLWRTSILDIKKCIIGEVSTGPSHSVAGPDIIYVSFV